MTLIKTPKPLNRFDELMNQVRDLSFRIFERRAGEPGCDIDDWLAAERELFDIPMVEVSETETEYELKVDTEDFQPQNLEVTASTEGVAIESSDTGQDGKKVFRYIRFNCPVAVDQVTAAFSEGTLTVHAPKQSMAVTKPIPIETPKAAAAKA